MKAWHFIAYLLAASITTYAAIVTVPEIVAPVQAAPPAPPTVVPCQLVNTAKVSDVLTILVFRCQPENGAPYLLNTVGFMKDEE